MDGGVQLCGDAAGFAHGGGFDVVHWEEGEGASEPPLLSIFCSSSGGVKKFWSTQVVVEALVRSCSAWRHRLSRVARTSCSMAGEGGQVSEAAFPVPLEVCRRPDV